MKNYSYNILGTIDCVISHPEYGDIPTTLDDEESKKIIGLGVEIAPYVQPVKTLDDIREERDLLLAQNVDIYNPLRWAELSADQKAKVKTYRQALLDITKQDPASVTWPELPLI